MVFEWTKKDALNLRAEVSFMPALYLHHVDHAFSVLLSRLLLESEYSLCYSRARKSAQYQVLCCFGVRSTAPFLVPLRLWLSSRAEGLFLVVSILKRTSSRIPDSISLEMASILVSI